MPDRLQIMHNQLENLRNDPHRVGRLTANTPHFRTKIFTNTGCLKKPRKSGYYNYIAYSA